MAKDYDWYYPEESDEIEDEEEEAEDHTYTTMGLSYGYGSGRAANILRTDMDYYEYYFFDDD